MRRRAVTALVGWTAAAGVTSARSQAASAPESAASRPDVGELKALGTDRFQIGSIIVDKAARSFVIPGRVLALGKPLEYLATSPGGLKAYETLFEVDATGSELNLACILVGLDADAKDRPSAAPRGAPLAGRRVDIFVAWTVGTTRHRVTAAEAVLNDEAGVTPASVEWVYIGSPARDRQGRLSADIAGTLIGFKREDITVIESALGIGVGAYGTVRGHPMLPPSGSAIELIVEVPKVMR